jgi:hypothetical protein
VLEDAEVPAGTRLSDEVVSGAPVGSPR